MNISVVEEEDTNSSVEAEDETDEDNQQDELKRKEIIIKIPADHEYPWSKLWEKCKTTGDLLGHDDNMKMLTKQQRVVDEQVRVIADLQRKVLDLEEKRAESQQEERSWKEHMQQKIQTCLDEQQTSTFQELEYIILVQSILSHKAFPAKSAGFRRQETLKKVLQWLAQRQSVIQYLNTKTLFPEFGSSLEEILYVDKTKLLGFINKYAIEV